MKHYHTTVLNGLLIIFVVIKITFIHSQCMKCQWHGEDPPTKTQTNKKRHWDKMVTYNAKEKPI